MQYTILIWPLYRNCTVTVYGAFKTQINHLSNEWRQELYECTLKKQTKPKKNPDRKKEVIGWGYKTTKSRSIKMKEVKIKKHITGKKVVLIKMFKIIFKKHTFSFSRYFSKNTGNLKGRGTFARRSQANWKSFSSTMATESTHGATEPELQVG